MSLIRRIDRVLEVADNLEVATQLLALPEHCSEEQLHAAIAYQLARQCEDWGLRMEYLLAFDQNNELVHAAYMPSPSRYFDFKGIRTLGQILEQFEVNSNLRVERHNRIDILHKHAEALDPACMEAAQAVLLATVAALESAVQPILNEEDAGALG